MNSRFHRLLAILLLPALLLSLPAYAQGATNLSPWIAKATGVRVTPAKATIMAGETVQLAAQVLPMPDEAAEIAWVSEKPAVATVDASGLVTAVAVGGAYIRATDPATGKYARCRVTVVKPAVRQIVLAQSRVVLDVGEGYDGLLSPTVLPAFVTGVNVAWRSSSPRVAAVDAEGRVTARAAGQTTITATAGGKTAKCTVGVRGKNTTVTISAVGDVIMGGDPRPKSALSRRTEDVFKELLAQYGDDYPFQNVRNIFLSDDVTIANLEGTLTSSNSFSSGKPHVFRGEGRYAQIMRRNGVDVVTMANNHTLDFGNNGFAQTEKNLDKAGILNCYTMHANLSKNASKVINKDGVSVKIGFVGFTQSAYSSMVINTIRNLKRGGQCDLIIASFHWTGTEEWAAYGIGDGNAKFRKTVNLSKAAIDAGADLVLGHHRHVPSGIELYKGKYIVYDLANFIVGIKHKLNNTSLIFQQTFRVDENGLVEDAGIRVIPCTTTTEATQTYPVTDSFGQEGAAVNNFQPALLTGVAAEELLAKIESMSNVKLPR